MARKVNAFKVFAYNIYALGGLSLKHKRFISGAIDDHSGAFETLFGPWPLKLILEPWLFVLEQ
jgi:hypothetical protein